MDLSYRLPLLSVLWKIVILLAFPFVIWAYMQVTGIEFTDLDTGTNGHKLSIFFIYLAVVAVWWWLNVKVQRVLSRRV
ncbi:hypothetical protein [Motilimonas pumila]|uniref:Uncharacterized protein n=1 Tax=Motilimonas pumila TaxID=2303987 RepID=A0A418YJ31_9GAMM|nr:hypothetical protein [Motilimonas pumila]RJG50655.1 hypothetical protein D1Z90_04055 [Motilimonas pumila]